MSGEESAPPSASLRVAFDVDFSHRCESDLRASIGHAIMQRPLRLVASLVFPCHEVHRCLQLRYLYNFGLTPGISSNVPSPVSLQY
jgi:hypothetical protein